MIAFRFEVYLSAVISVLRIGLLMSKLFFSAFGYKLWKVILISKCSFKNDVFIANCLVDVEIMVCVFANNCETELKTLVISNVYWRILICPSWWIVLQCQWLSNLMLALHCARLSSASCGYHVGYQFTSVKEWRAQNAWTWPLGWMSDIFNFILKIPHLKLVMLIMSD